ncbi:MAG: hypothetical protein GF331_21085 [Chitinivibrionales bacterium]|nr:hypothetical protein [Chitinivibrionales bacterium]
MDSVCAPGSCGRLASALAAAMPHIGYCVRLLDSAGISGLADTTASESRVMLIAGTAAAPENPSAVVQVGLAEADARGPSMWQAALERPLVQMAYAGEDPATFEAVLVSKIVENMRASFVCHFAVASSPDTVAVKTSTGLEGSTPVEWILPLGATVELSAHKERYLEHNRDITLEEPGYHTYHIDLIKRRFYHSRLMIPTAIFAAAAGAFYLCDRYYYDQYSALDESDYHENPDSFEELYTTALVYERCSQVALALAGVSFTLSFWF